MVLNDSKLMLVIRYYFSPGGDEKKGEKKAERRHVRDPEVFSSKPPVRSKRAACWQLPSRNRNSHQDKQVSCGWLVNKGIKLPSERLRARCETLFAQHQTYANSSTKLYYIQRMANIWKEHFTKGIFTIMCNLLNFIRF